MAHIIPSDLTCAALAGAKSPELETLPILRDALPNDYTIFHGIHWMREYETWTHFGEIDFIVLDPAGAVLLIEQKNGALAGTEAGLVKYYEDNSKSVAHQINRAVEKVLDKFKWQHGRDARLELDYLVYLPDHRVKNVNAVGLDIDRIVDAPRRDRLAERIEQLLGRGTPNPAWHDKVHEFFCQTCELVPDMHAHLAAQEKAWVRYAGALVAILDNLEMCPLDKSHQ